MQENNNKSRGGRRDGAGRPKTVGSSRTIAIRIPEDVAAILDQQPNKSAYIINAIRAFEKSNKK